VFGNKTSPIGLRLADVDKFNKQEFFILAEIHNFAETKISAIFDKNEYIST